MADNVDHIKVRKIEVNNDKVVIKDITLEDLELNLFGKIIKIIKVEINEIELDKISF